MYTEELVVGGVIVALIGLLIYGSVQENREWERFRNAHNCRVVGHMDGSIGTGVGPAIGGNGGVAVTTVSIPGKTGWLCDDGITYWRSN